MPGIRVLKVAGQMCSAGKKEKQRIRLAAFIKKKEKRRNYMLLSYIMGDDGTAAWHPLASSQ